MKAVLINDEIAYIGELLNGIIIPINRELSIKKSGTNYELLQYIYNYEGVNRNNLSMIKFSYVTNESNNRFAIPYEMAIIKYKGNFKRIASILSREYNVKIDIAEYNGQDIDDLKYFKLKFSNENEIILIEKKMIRATIPINNELKFEYLGAERLTLIYPFDDWNSDGFMIEFPDESTFNIMAMNNYNDSVDFSTELINKYNVGIRYTVINKVELR